MGPVQIPAARLFRAIIFRWMAGFEARHGAMGSSLAHGWRACQPQGAARTMRASRGDDYRPGGQVSNSGRDKAETERLPMDSVGRQQQAAA
jgi:hypothetical protein